ncbi:hypothetical protein VW35_19470 [Devosia soli]|uniref:Calcineurin-like phosphoesterase domain-containing protein n=1 Tax=Devosia soli TaxID=361041 RepID=A0A0F5L2S0_9HYPH|nr:metallophosphoesterase family protein [Devosia soli]KKB75927.1 hypothetical protein VW35_19470 [Devosia soli]
MFGLFGKRPVSSGNSAARVTLETQPDVIYAIGDIHGCLDKLKRLEALISADAAGIAGEKLIITLGDYVDRGPNSAQTLNWLAKAPPDGFKRLCLRGNHEALFLQAIENPRTARNWLQWGGKETLLSYGIDSATFQRMGAKSQLQVMQGMVPEEHVTFLKSCPIMVGVGEFLFVHAGIRPGLSLAQQRDEDLIWIRDPFLIKDHGLGIRVVHGHTPAAEPQITSFRIGIDTAAYDGGPLTALKITRTGDLGLLSSEMTLN